MDEELAGSLRKLLPEDGQPSVEDLADLVWAARFVGRDLSADAFHGERSPGPAWEAAPTRSAASGEEDSLLPPHHPGPDVDPWAAADQDDEPSVPVYAVTGRARTGEPSSGQARHSGVSVVRVRREGMLHHPLALARALRPLRKQVRAPGRPVLDERTTATATAETSLLMPSWLPRTERLYSVDLVVDSGSSMVVWRQLALELRALLEGHGAFRVVRTWALDPDGAMPRLTPFHHEHQRRSGARPAAEQLRSTTGRRLLLLLTDGVGEHWGNESFLGVLSAWARTRPTAVLQTLPRRMWHRTGIHTEPVLGWPAPAGASAPVIRPQTLGHSTAGHAQDTVWVPVLEVDADWLGPWARMVARTAAAPTPLVALPLDKSDCPLPLWQAHGGRDERSLTPEVLVEQFRGEASTDAFELAGYLAGVPLVLPVMRMVQRAMMPASSPALLAEVFLSGLLVPGADTTGPPDDPDLVLYDFRAGVRDILLATLTRRETLRVLNLMAKVSGRVARGLGGTLNFRALVPGPGDSAMWQIPAESIPFAQVAVRVLSRLGGEFAAAATEITNRMPSAEPDQDRESGTTSTDRSGTTDRSGHEEASSPTAAGSHIEPPALPLQPFSDSVAVDGDLGPPSADRLLLDVSPEGLLQVSSWLRGEMSPHRVGPRTAMTWPMREPDLAALHWYLDDFPKVPFGVYRERGARVAAQLADWGRDIFDAVFADGPAREVFRQTRSRGGPLEIIIRSASGDHLELPWELMTEPHSEVPLGLEGVRFLRSPYSTDASQVFDVSAQRLRILMVISRPLAEADVGYTVVARPLVRRLETVRGAVDLVVLRPATLEHLDEVLTRAHEDGKPFQVVHFDGHGAAAPPQGEATPPPSRSQGVVIFERPHGGRHVVTVDALSQVLTHARVPVVVFNSSQSARSGTRDSSSLPVQLLRRGTSCVVAMNHNVYAVAMAEFMSSFYERLFAGDSVAAAVASGRRRLALHDLRPTPAGSWPIADWITPVLYARADVRFPHLARRRNDEETLAEALDRIPHASDSPLGAPGEPLEPANEFIGRDTLFHALEVGAQHRHVMILHGPAGVGKTETAKAFARWWRDTGGVDDPQWIVWHSFEPGVTWFAFDAVINAIGLQVYGAQFTTVPVHHRRDLVEMLLTERRLLLVWDNFEAVSSIPDPSQVTPPPSPQELEDIRRLLSRVGAAGRSTVLIISRTNEEWLGETPRRIQVEGLNAEEAAAYADLLLAPHPSAQRRRASAAFDDLMRWLDGHPLSMRLVLPHLETTSAGELLAGLSGRVPLPDAVDSMAVNPLTAGIAYAFQRLTENEGQVLALLSLCHGLADADVLGYFSSLPDTPEQFRGRAATGWSELLEQTANLGLVTSLGTGMFRVHPALPAFLTTYWRTRSGEKYPAECLAATRSLVRAYAAFGSWIQEVMEGENAAIAIQFIALHRRTMGNLLQDALDYQEWQEAQAILQPLETYWRARGMNEEAASWGDRVRLTVEDPSGNPPPLTTPAGALWLFVVDAQGTRELDAGRLDQAARTYQSILALLNGPSGDPRHIHRLALVRHQLGVIAQQAGRLDEAEQWFRQSLVAMEDLGDRGSMANVYHQLGNVAYLRGSLDQAEEWYRQALIVKEDLGNQAALASTYHQLGMVAQHRGDLDAAEHWTQQSLERRESVGDRPGAARSYHQMGMLAMEHGRLEEAEEWYHRALTIFQDTGTRPDMASTSHQLGTVAHRRGRLQEAEQWYRQALAINEELGNRFDLTRTYHQLGLIAQERDDLDGAEQWLRQTLALADELGDLLGAAAASFQLGLVSQKRKRLGEAEEWYRRVLSIDEELGDRSGVARAYLQLGLIAQDQGRLEEAAGWYQRAQLLDEHPPFRFRDAGSSEGQ